ncbi:MarR-like DNA-binding transcriptional regulator SgrR of sgrS sRNA [Paenibacillus mucilaginosus]|uniref:SgrR family transcriptional regulator n=1 Tax=Paenibacillus mucilaginosus TaxID=61624 RepID=UPI003D2171C2
MQTVLPYLELRRMFSEQEAETPFPVTVDRLAGIWHCTPRYVKAIVRTLHEQGWIEWQPGRGRGHTSTLTLRMDADELLLQEVRRRMEQGEVQEAMELLNRFGGPAVKDRFLDWMSEGIGFSTQQVSDTVQETLRLPVYRSITTLDPGLVYYAFDCHLARQVFHTLVEYDDEQGRVLPGIAHSWESRSDAAEWTFHLRKGILFHHGRELTAEDVVYTLSRLRDNPARFAGGWRFQGISQLEALNRKTVRIRLREPNHLLPRFLSTIPAAVVPREVVERDEAGFAQVPVGTGPFRVVSRTGGRCVLEAFPAHFRGRAHLDRVELLILAGLDAGRLKEPDWTSIMTSHGENSSASREALLSGGSGWNSLETRFTCCSLLVFNQAKPGPQRHPAFREALHHMLDREALIAELGGDRICPAHGFQPKPSRSGDTAAGTQKRSGPDIAALLEESGCREEPLKLVTYPYHEADARWIADRAASFGVQVELTVRSTAEWGDTASLAEYDCQLYGVVVGGDEVRELELYLQGNFFAPLWDEATAEAVRQEAAGIFREAEEAGRRERLAKLEQRIRETHAVLFLVHKSTNTAFHQSVRGVRVNSYGWVDFDRIWFHPEPE